MPNIAKACERMRYWCEDGNLGYDQSNRWDIRPGGETDCSALVIHVLREAGFDTGDASYTGDMSYNLTRRGWKRLPADLSTARPGDILLNDSHHVALVIGGNGWEATIGQASIDEHGRASGGASGDQTGRETNTRPIYEYSRGWDCILRYDGPLDVNMKRKERAMEFLIQPDGQPRMDYVCGDAIHPLHHPDEIAGLPQVLRRGHPVLRLRLAGGTVGDPTVRCAGEVMMDANDIFEIEGELEPVEPVDLAQDEIDAIFSNEEQCV